MAYDNTNRGVLFRNEKKETDEDSDKQGKLDIQGEEHWFDGYDQSDGTISLRARTKKKEGRAAIHKGKIKKADKEGKSENYPDWKGWLKLEDGTEYWVSGWKRTYEDKESGEEKPLLSVSIEKKEQQATSTHAPAAAETEDDDEIPF